MRFTLISILLSLCCVLPATQLQVDISGARAILVNAHTGTVLFEKQADERAAPASITKIATTLAVLSWCHNLEEIVSVPKEALTSITPQAKKDSKYRAPSHWLETDGTHMGLQAAEELPVMELIYGTMLASANDASNVLALHCRGSMTDFIDDLNQFLVSIGCQNTHFMNPHGLHHPDHYTTARDLAIMTRKGMQIPLFRQIVGTARHACPRTNLQEERSLVTTNMFLRKGGYYDPRVIGVKTGRTQAAGAGMVAAAQDQGRELLAVVLGAPSRADLLRDVKALFDAAYAQPLKKKVYVRPGVTPLTTKVSHARHPLVTTVQHEVAYSFFPAEEDQIDVQVQWNLPSLPIAKGTRVGDVLVINQRGVVLQREPLLALHEVRRSYGLLLSILIPISLVLTGIVYTMKKKS